MMKGYKWSLGTLVESWLDLIGTGLIVLSVVSYIQVIATHQLSWWNVFNIFLIKM